MMKFFGLLKNKRGVKPTTFGQKRAVEMKQRLSKAINERKIVLRKEYASPDPINKMYQRKGRQLDAQIRKFTDEK